MAECGKFACALFSLTNDVCEVSALIVLQAEKPLAVSVVLEAGKITHTHK